MPPVDHKFCFFPLIVDRLLGFRNGRRRLDRHAENEIAPVHGSHIPTGICFSWIRQTLWTQCPYSDKRSTYSVFDPYWFLLSIIVWLLLFFNRVKWPIGLDFPERMLRRSEQSISLHFKIINSLFHSILRRFILTKREFYCSALRKRSLFSVVSKHFVRNLYILSLVIY